MVPEASVPQAAGPQEAPPGDVVAAEPLAEAPQESDGGGGLGCDIAIGVPVGGELAEAPQPGSPAEMNIEFTLHLCFG